jgi:hypothetical protein
MGFARSLGFGRLTFINPWAMIATRPRDLWVANDPVGSLNDHHIAQVSREVGQEGGAIVGAWGRLSPPAAKRALVYERLRRVLEIVRQNESEIWALGVNSDGSPKHPLYLPKSATLSIWKGQDSHRP